MKVHAIMNNIKALFGGAIGNANVMELNMSQLRQHIGCDLIHSHLYYISPNQTARKCCGLLLLGIRAFHRGVLLWKVVIAFFFVCVVFVLTCKGYTH